MAYSTLSDVPEASLTPSTIKQMYNLVDQAKTDEKFQKLIYSVVNRAMPGTWKQYKQELQAVFDWYRSKVDYRRDPVAVELLQDVWATLDRGRGDCDDASIFLAAAAEILGSPAEFVTVSTRPDKEPQHVYPEARVNGVWYPMDATVKTSYVGWEPTAGITDKKIWSRQDVGLAGIEERMIDGLGQATDPSAVTLVVTPGPASAPVLNSSNFTAQPAPGGGVYNQGLPVAPTPTPAELFTSIPANQVPPVLDPLEDFWGGKKTLRESHSVMMPQHWVEAREYMKELSGLGEFVAVPKGSTNFPELGELADVVTSELDRMVSEGDLHPTQIPNMLGAIFNPQHPWRTGAHGPGKQTFWQRNERLGSAIKGAIKTHRLSSHNPTVEVTTMLGQMPQVDPALHQAVLAETAKQLPAALKRHGVHPLKLKFKQHMGHHVRAVHRGVEGLGQTTDPATQAAQNNAIANVATSVTSAIAGQVAPTDASSITSAVSTGINALLGISPTAPTPWSTILPVAAIGALLLGGWWVSRKPKSKGYRANPSRRRSSYRRGGGGGGGKILGMDQKTALIVGGLGLGYWFYTKSAAAAPKTTTSTSPLAAVGGVLSSIGKLFGGGSTTPAPSAGGATATAAAAPSSSPGMVTSIPGLYSPNAPSSTPAPAPAPVASSTDTSSSSSDSGFVTDLSAD